MDAAFLSNFKKQTEAKWAAEGVAPGVYGFQIQQGTKWNPGLSNSEIAEYEKAIGAVFPDDYRMMLRHVNGTDLPSLNVYGNCGDPHRKAFRLYAFQRDLAIVKERMQMIDDQRDGISKVLLEHEQFELSPDAVLVPIYEHRYLICDTDRTVSRVLSIMGLDAIVFGSDLKSYVTREFLSTRDS